MPGRISTIAGEISALRGFLRALRIDAESSDMILAALDRIAVLDGERVAQDVQITRGPLAGMRQRRYVDPSP